METWPKIIWVETEKHSLNFVKGFMIDVPLVQ